MELSKLKKTCLHYKDSAPALFIDPIPEKKANNARESLHIPQSEGIFALIDLTIFGSAKNAIVVTDGGLYWKDDNDKYPFFISWLKLQNCDPVETQGSHAKNIKFNDGLQVNLLGSGSLGEDNNNIVLQLVKDLKLLSEGEVRELQTSDISDRLDFLLLWDICNKYRGSASEYYLDPIPEKKVDNARESLNIPAAERLVALIDFTTFGSAKDSMVITCVGLYWMDFLTPKYLSWEDLRHCTPCEDASLLTKSIIFNDKSKMVFKDNLKISLSGSSTFMQSDNHVVIQLINDIKSMLVDGNEGEFQANTISNDLSQGFIECEFCQGKIKPEVTYCKHCGVKLRG